MTENSPSHVVDQGMASSKLAIYTTFNQKTLHLTSATPHQHITIASATVYTCTYNNEAMQDEHMYI